MNGKDFKKEYQRIRLIKEMIETERFYVTNLKSFTENYYQPLKNSTSIKKVPLDEKEIKEIFSNGILIIIKLIKYIKLTQVC
jgi:hypothetical protein